MTMTSLRDAARLAYGPVAEKRRRQRQDAAEVQRELDRQYQNERDALRYLLHANLGMDDASYEVFTEGLAYPGFVPPKPVARVEGLLFFIAADEATDLPVLKMTFDDAHRFRYQTDVYSLADVGEAIEAYGELTFPAE